MTGCSYSSVTASRDTPEEAKKKKKTGGNCLVAVRMPLVWLRHRPDGRDGARLLFVRPQPGERERSCLDCEQPPVGDDRCCGPANDRNRARQGRDACRRPEQGAVSGLLLRACGSGRTATLPVKPSVASRSAACCLLLAACRRCCCCLVTGVGISLSSRAGVRFLVYYVEEWLVGFKMKELDICSKRGCPLCASRVKATSVSCV